MDIFYTGSDRDKLPEKYCSCIFKVIANNYARRQDADPYAICSSSVYNSRGFKGPGRVSCRYSLDYFDSLDTDTLLNYARAKGLISVYSLPDRESLIEIIDNFFTNEENAFARRSSLGPSSPRYRGSGQMSVQRSTFEASSPRYKGSGQKSARRSLEPSSPRYKGSEQMSAGRSLEPSSPRYRGSEQMSTGRSLGPSSSRYKRSGQTSPQRSSGI